MPPLSGWRVTADMLRTVSSRHGRTLIALALVIAVAAALLPGTVLSAFSVPTFTFVVLTFSWRVSLPQDPALPALLYVRAPLDTRGPPARLTA